jgi:uncharacterized protein (DUF1697 family)
VALIRGINVGKNKRVAMSDLRKLVTDLGYGDARTLLNSGNVVFTVPGRLKADPAKRIEMAMEAKLGLSARVMVLSARELAVAIRENPLLDIANDHSRLLVMVLASPSDRSRLKPLADQDWKPDALAIGHRWAYLWCASGLIESRLGTSVMRLLGETGTGRNWATMLKLHALIGAAS